MNFCRYRLQLPWLYSGVTPTYVHENENISILISNFCVSLYPSFLAFSDYACVPNQSKNLNHATSFKGRVSNLKLYRKRIISVSLINYGTSCVSRNIYNVQNITLFHFRYRKLVVIKG